MGDLEILSTITPATVETGCCALAEIVTMKISKAVSSLRMVIIWFERAKV
jgi:hypothetical protein